MSDARPLGPLVCVACSGPLHRPNGALACSVCARNYPLVTGVPVLVEAPGDFLLRAAQALEASRHTAASRLRDLDGAWRARGLPAAGLVRQKQLLSVNLARLDRLIDLLRPASEVAEGLANQSGKRLAAPTAGESGWNVDALLLYFIRDWHANRELQAAQHLIAAAIASSFAEGQRDTLVFAGCGAGGLLAEPQPSFRRVIGFDLSLPAVLLASAMLRGQRLTLPVVVASSEGPRMTEVTLSAARANPDVELLVADACRTPLAAGSVDCVVTRFLLDVVPDPRAVAAEVRRILAPEGLWINYGPTGAPASLWHFDEAEMSAFLEEAGFALVSSQQHRTTHLDCGQLDPLASHEMHVCRLTVARPGLMKPVARVPVAASQPASVADRVPVHHAGAEVLERRGLEHARRELLLVHERIRGYPERFEIGAGIEQALTLIDGARTVGDIAQLLNQGPANYAIADTVTAFDRFVELGLIGWRDDRALGGLLGPASLVSRAQA